MLVSSKQEVRPITPKEEWSKKAPISVGLGFVLARGALSGLVVGLLANLLDVLITSHFGRDYPIIPALGQSLAMWVPLCWVLGAGVSALVELLGRISEQIQVMVIGSFPYLWLLAVYIYLSIAYFHGLNSFAGSAKCLLIALVSGLPSYLVLRYFFLKLGKMSASGMLAVALLVSLALWIEWGVWYLSL
jgi:hypothetical protein